MVQVTSLGGKRHTLYVFFRCDETPLKMCVLDLDTLFGIPTHLIQELGDMFGEICDRTVGVSKLLQSEITFVILVSIDSMWRMFSWCPPMPIQSM